tara:strand:+ start:1316 stop:2602 length:1287 start_codon:yes stop_codon:yes gene_type:complete
VKKVLIISYYWPPSGGAGVQRWLKFVKYLPEFKIHPIVVTVDENFAAYPKLDNSFDKDIEGVEVYKTKATDYYKFYTQFKGEKKIPQGGVPSAKSGWKNKVSLAIRNHLFIPDPRVGWNKFAINKATELIEKGEIDIVITTSPPHSTQMIGLALKEKFPNIKWIADLRDPWTNIYYYKDLGHSKWSDKANQKKELEVLEKADDVIVVSPHMKLLFESKSKTISANKIKVIPNGFDHTEFENIIKERNPEFNITYVGTANKDYDIDGFLLALLQLKKENISFKWNIVGDFSDDVKRTIKESGLLPYVKYHGYLPHSEAIKHTILADLLLLIIPNVPNNKLIYSGKLFEYIATKNPILCLGPDDGDAAELIKKNNLGKNFIYDQHEDISNYIKKTFTKYSCNESIIKNFDSNQFSRKQLTKTLVNLLNKF